MATPLSEADCQVNTVSVHPDQGSSRWDGARHGRGSVERDARCRGGSSVWRRAVRTHGRAPVNGNL